MALLRAVFYCRCSTEEETQVDALNKQVLESEACIQEQGWFLVGRYVESKSGTTTKGRNEYNRLYEDLLADKFDIIVIKSQDRLMRNVKDWYLFLDRMLTREKRLFIYLERKFYTADDALITGIKAILAEEYSRELSKKINNAHQHRQRNGGKPVLTSRVFGFCKTSAGSLMVVEEEAEIIRKIYEYCAAGYGSPAIANIFLNQGYVKRTGSVLTASWVRKIIRNPLYKGTMVMNRCHYDFETKRTIKLPKEQWIYSKNMVPAIVDSELWEQANQAMNYRAKAFGCNGVYNRENRKDTAMLSGSKAGKIRQYDLSGKLVCANCGKPYYRTRRHRYKNKEDIVVEWKCSSYLEKGRGDNGRLDMMRKVEKEFSGGCDNVHLDESIVISLLEQAGGQHWHTEQKDRIVHRAVQILQKALGSENHYGEWERIQREEERINRQKDFLLTKFLEGIIADKDYRKKNDDLEENLGRLQMRKEEWKQREREIKNLEQRMRQIKTRLEEGGVEKAITAQMLQDIREIRVHEWQLELRFKPLKMPPMPDQEKANGYLPQEILTKGITMWIDYPFPPETKRGRYLERRRIMKRIEEEPLLTAKRIAAETGHSVYMVRNRIAELTEAGYLQFHGRGRHGRWEVLKKLSDKEKAFKDGEL
ncbi:MAG: recombinase family protein [Lachnospiraceae bacterium]|jgi:site-specific DNA recombinase|nr:recombinase family protein [Lachnospiraceae bacterium]